MLTLQGKYRVSDTKRLTILAESGAQRSEALTADIVALRAACHLNSGRCEVHVSTQHGLMYGTLVEKKPRRFNLWQFEGHLSFPQRA
ncbi:hypothetical protein Dcar01_02481 [Deinococcus carri]|uniref:Uncharacterized protein n=1 Tax=Deinococcus carri TaxID=1211323 RepID=A0ABP9W8R6_9DEIO